MNLDPEQLKMVVEAPIQIMKGMMSAEGSSVLGMVKEGAAAFDFVSAARARFKDNTLIQQAVARFVNFTEKGTKDPTSSDPNAPTTSADFLSYAAKVADVLEQVVGGTDGPGFKQFLYELAEEVAKAAGGGMLGMKADVSAAESDFLAKLKAALRLG